MLIIYAKILKLKNEAQIAQIIRNWTIRQYQNSMCNIHHTTNSTV